MHNLARRAVCAIWTIAACTSIGGGEARAADQLDVFSMAIAIYEDENNDCEYTAVVGDALVKLDQFFAESEPQRWGSSKIRTKESAFVLPNIMKAVGNPSSDLCGFYGKTIAQALTVSTILIGTNEQLDKEIVRLQNIPMQGAPSANMGEMMNNMKNQSLDESPDDGE